MYNIDEIIKELSVYGKVELLDVSDTQVEVKVTDGFDGKYEPTMRVGEIMLTNFYKFKTVKYAKAEFGLCHYIFE